MSLEQDFARYIRRHHLVSPDSSRPMSILLISEAPAPIWYELHRLYLPFTYASI